MGRTIIVGDVHGCREELERLLDHVGLTSDDKLVMAGDLVVRGPDPAGVVDLVMRLGAPSVRGNHEDRLLRLRQSHGAPRVGTMTRATARALRGRHWEWLASLPLGLALPEHSVRVVHAGVVPGVPYAHQPPRALMYMRTLDEHGEPREQREGPGRTLWGACYGGAEHVVFGHHARPEPQLHAHATGIDTGCVYGGRLTAMVLRPGETPPPPEERGDVLVSVPARRAYVSQ
jgi:hypothetical protein